MQNIQLIQLLSDVGAGKRGSHLGALALSERLNLTPTVCVENHDRTDFSTRPTKYIDNLARFFHHSIPALSSLFRQPQLPVILSGDHTNAIGAISALCQAHPDKRIGVIWIDAHADLHTPYTTPSGNLHGMSLAALCRQDNLPCAIHTLTDAQQAYWQQLKQLSAPSSGILPQDICFLGLRDYEAQEATLIEQFAIPHYSVEQIRQMGLEQVLSAVKSQCEAVDLLYVSLDVDSLDSQLFSATGTPVGQGFSEQELAQLLAAILRYPQLAAFEMTEFNPSLNDDPQQAEIIHRLFAQALALCAERARNGDKRLGSAL